MVEVNDGPFSETSLQVPMPVVSHFVGFTLRFLCDCINIVDRKRRVGSKSWNLKESTVYCYLEARSKQLCDCKNAC